MKKKSFEVHDRNLWDEVARSIRPLGKRALKMSAASVSLPKQSVHVLTQKASTPKISLNKICCQSPVSTGAPNKN